MPHFLSALAPDDVLGVVFVGYSNLSQNVTTDRALLSKTVDRVRDALGFGLMHSGIPTRVMSCRGMRKSRPFMRGKRTLS